MPREIALEYADSQQTGSRVESMKETPVAKNPESRVNYIYYMCLITSSVCWPSVAYQKNAVYFSSLTYNGFRKRPP